MRASSRARFASLLLSLVAIACAGSPQPLAYEESRGISGVELRIVVRHPDATLARTAVAEAFAAADATGARLLATRAGSEIDLLTRVPSRLWIEVAPETRAALALAARIAEETDGAYDPTWPSLLRVWGLHEGGTPHVPRDFEIEMALRRVDWEDVELRQDGRSEVRRLSRRTVVDLGGVARGSMVDAAVARLRELGVMSARVGTATEHVYFGGSEAHPWRIAPTAISGHRHQGRDGVVAFAIRRERDLGAGPVSDRFDPRSGRPAEETRWTSVSAQSAAASAGYASALFAMGSEAQGWIEAHPELACAIRLR